MPEATSSPKPGTVEDKKEVLTDFEINDEFLIKYVMDKIKDNKPPIPHEIHNFFGSDDFFKVCNNFIKCQGNEEAYNEINKLIEKTKVLDWALFLVEKRYRDHYKHQFNVAAFGEYLMDTRVLDNKTLFEQMTDYLRKKRNAWTNDDTRIAWWIAALLHDHAYPIAYFFEASKKMIWLGKRFDLLQENIDKIKDGLSEAYKDALSAKLDKTLQSIWMFGLEEKRLKDTIEESIKILASMETETTANIFKIIDKNKYDHGIISGTNLILTTGNRFLTSPVAEAAEAIMLHNIYNLPHRIDFSKDPIAFLLILCDELQEWGREIVIGRESEIELSKINIGLKGYASVRAFDQTLQIKFDYDNDIVKRTGWDLHKFIDSKKKSLSRLKFVEILNPKEIKIIVNSSLAIDLLKSYEFKTTES